LPKKRQYRARSNPFKTLFKGVRNTDKQKANTEKQKTRKTKQKSKKTKKRKNIRSYANKANKQNSK